MGLLRRDYDGKYTPSPAMLAAEAAEADRKERFALACSAAKARGLVTPEESGLYGLDEADEASMRIYDSARVVIDGFYFYDPAVIEVGLAAPVCPVDEAGFWAAAAGLPKVKDLGNGITFFSGTIAGRPARVWVSPSRLRGDLEGEPGKYWAFEMRRA